MRGIVYLKLGWGRAGPQAMVSVRLLTLPPTPSRLREGECAWQAVAFSNIFPYDNVSLPDCHPPGLSGIDLSKT